MSVITSATSAHTESSNRRERKSLSRSATHARITGFGGATPATEIAQKFPDSFPGRDDDYRIAQRYAPVFSRIMASSGIDHRYVAVSPILEDVWHWSTETRMRRFVQDALPLATKAVSDALANSDVAPAEIGFLCTVSSTGYTAPGIDTWLIRDLGIPPDVQRVSVGHMGCFAAIPGLALCSDFVRCHDRPAMLLNVELSSLHVQPPPWDAGQIVINSLFGDAATATIVEPGPGGAGDASGGFEVIDIHAHTDTDHQDDITWQIGDHGFRMGLSTEVPDGLGVLLPTVIDDLLAPHHLDLSDISWWAVHPGGCHIIDAVQNSLALTAADVAVSRSVLRDYGNCASAGIAQVLDAVRTTAPPAIGEYGIAMAFGPGLTLYTALLRAA